MPLTASEFRLLSVLAHARGSAVSRNRLADVAARATANGNPESVSVLIHRLRRVLQHAVGQQGEALIRTVPRTGYCLDVAG